MATIALHANTMNQMPALISDIKQSVSTYKSDLFSLRQKALNVEKSICNLDDVISSIQTSTQTQEEKIETLETLSQNCEAFAADAMRADEAVTDTINQNKADFYEQYDYLKPDSEKSDWEKFWDDAGTWCKEHWKEIVAVVVTIVVVVCIVCIAVATFGGAAVAIAALVGGLLSVAGQLVSDLVILAITGKWQGSIMGYVGAFVGGAVGGILMITPAGAGCSALVGSVFGKAGVSLAIDAFVSTSLTENFENIFGIEDRSFSEIVLDICGSVALAFVLGKIFEGPTKAISQKLAKSFPNVTPIQRLIGTHGYSVDFSRQLTRAAKNQVPFELSIFSRYFKTFRNGLLGGYAEGFFENIAQGVVDVVTD